MWIFFFSIEVQILQGKLSTFVHYKVLQQYNSEKRVLY